MGKPYYEICDSLAVKMIYEPYSLFRLDKIVFKNGKMDLPEIPISRYLETNQKSMDSEMIQTLVEHCNISHVEAIREVVNKMLTILQI